ncbi:hypothetical protein KI387_036887, partial [Taxus chinensis]
SDSTFHELTTSPIQEEVENEDPGDGIIQLKGNKIPKGLVSLEEIFDKHDNFIKEKEHEGITNYVDYEKIDFDTKDKPHLINI